MKVKCFVLMLMIAVVRGNNECPPKCRCHKRTVYCNERNLTSVPRGIPLDTEKLFLQQNQLQDPDMDGQLSQLSKLHHLFLDNNLLTSFPNHLPSSLRSISLNHNIIKYVPTSALVPLVNVQQLLLDYNNLTDNGLVSGSLQKSTKLQKLLLGHNLLTTLPWQLPTSLCELYISDNLMTSLPPDRLRHLVNLNKLDLRNNQIVQIDGDMTSLVNLQSLDLSSNKLREIPASLPSNLTELRLGYNQIRFVYANRGMGRDGRLHGDLHGFSSLAELDLSHNLLESIESGAFSGLHGNGLSVGLQMNAWRCDCNLHYLKTWLTSHTIVTSSDANIQCSTPESFSQVAISSIEVTALKCQNPMRSFRVNDVTHDTFTLFYDIETSTEPPYLQMWTMYGPITCQDCRFPGDSDVTAASWMGSYKVVAILTNQVHVDKLGPGSKLLVCVFSTNQHPSRIPARQCQLVTTMEVVTSQSNIGVPSWGVAVASTIASVIIIIFGIAFIIRRLRAQKRHRKMTRYHNNRLRLAPGAPFMLSHAQQPPLVDADHEFDVALMTSRTPVHHVIKSQPNDSCCYSDSHADSIETTETVTSLRYARDYPANYSSHDSTRSYSYHGNNVRL